MLRINIGLVLAWSCFAAAPVSADFIDVPTSGLATLEDAVADVEHGAAVARSRDSSASELWRDSAYLELGYYSLDGRTPHKQLARPNEAALEDSQGSEASLFGTWVFGPQSPAALARLSVGVAALLGIAAFATRRHWLARPPV
jgi:hypothetical protein